MIDPPCRSASGSEIAAPNRNAHPNSSARRQKKLNFYAPNLPARHRTHQHLLAIFKFHIKRCRELVQCQRHSSGATVAFLSLHV